MQQEHYNLSNGELERLAILMEEAGEVVKDVGKIMRFGWESKKIPDPERDQPGDSDHFDNRRLLTRELGDIMGIIDLMIQSGDIDAQELAFEIRAKKSRINKWLKHNKV